MTIRWSSRSAGGLGGAALPRTRLLDLVELVGELRRRLGQAGLGLGDGAAALRSLLALDVVDERVHRRDELRDLAVRRARTELLERGRHDRNRGPVRRNLHVLQPGELHVSAPARIEKRELVRHAVL